MKLLVLSKHNCSGCGFVKSFLDGQGVQYDTVNIQEDVEFAVKYEIMSVPVTILLDENEKEVSRVAGFAPPELEKLITQL
jgi:thioredoxin 1